MILESVIFVISGKTWKWFDGNWEYAISSILTKMQSYKTESEFENFKLDHKARMW